MSQVVDVAPAILGLRPADECDVFTEERVGGAGARHRPTFTRAEELFPHRRWVPQALGAWVLPVLLKQNL